MYQFALTPNEYLSAATSGFYHVRYAGMGNPGNPDYVNVLKNTYGKCTNKDLTAAERELLEVFLQDFPRILSTTGFEVMTVCVVPRAKAEKAYQPNQLLFRAKARVAARLMSGFEDGTVYIRRYINTRTTHLRRTIPNYNNDGPDPFPGITARTCEISSRVIGKDILLVDDIYTPNVNIDEDAVQALLDARAKSVTFYAIGRVYGGDLEDN